MPTRVPKRFTTVDVISRKSFPTYFSDIFRVFHGRSPKWLVYGKSPRQKMMILGYLQLIHVRFATTTSCSTTGPCLQCLAQEGPLFFDRLDPASTYGLLTLDSASNR